LETKANGRLAYDFIALVLVCVYTLFAGDADGVGFLADAIDMREMINSEKIMWESCGLRVIIIPNLQIYKKYKVLWRGLSISQKLREDRIIF